MKNDAYYEGGKRLYGSDGSMSKSSLYHPLKVPRKDVLANGAKVSVLLAELEGSKDYKGVLPKLVELYEVLKKQYKDTEAVHFSAEFKDPQNGPLADLAGYNEGVLEVCMDKMKVAISFLKSDNEGELAISRLKDVVLKLDEYKDELGKDFED